MSEKKIKKRKEKNDAYVVTDLDPIQEMMTYLLGSRTENEAVCQVDIDMEALDNFIKKKNEKNPDLKFRYTLFHAVLAALARTIEVRPKLNYFIRNRKYWERKVISFSFVAKKMKTDGAEEGVVITEYDRDSDLSPLEQMYRSTCRIVSEIRKDKESKDDTVKIIASLLKLPVLILNPVMRLIKLLDRHGMLPKSFVNANPYGTTCFLSNLGSIKMNAAYHHLVNFGTNSIFGIIGEKTFRPVLQKDGSFVAREILPVSLTLDERIADGVYYANSLKYLKALLLKPELLELPSKEKIDFDNLLKKLEL